MRKTIAIYDSIYSSACTAFFGTSQYLLNNQTPDQFLGYTLGSKFTYHHQIIEYFKRVASQNPERMKLVTVWHHK